MAGTLPVGFRFRPTDEELINHYLSLKINGFEEEVSVIREVDISKNVNLGTYLDRKYQNGNRSKRATVAGYWRATGKDRFIKTSKGMNVIGKKKTLVFHIGRAPKGQRTNWVIHEYTATEEALNGTHTGQGAFVLCCLVKKRNEKQDEMAENSNCEEVEQYISSPTVVKSSAADNQSEPVSLILSQQPEMQSTSIERIVDKETTPDGPLPIADDAEDKGLDTSIQPDPYMENAFSNFYGPAEPSDLKIFSPFNLQMMNELGSLHSSTTFIDDNKAVQLQDGTNCVNFDEFLDSLLVISDEYSCENCGAVEQGFVKESGQLDKGFVCGGFFTEAQKVSPLQLASPSGGCITPDFSNDEAQRNLHFLQNRWDALSAVPVGDQVYSFLNLESSTTSNAVSSEDIGTGIIIRSPQPRFQSSEQGFVTQGIAPRRINLQKKLLVGSISCSLPKGFSYSEENSKVKPSAGEAEEAKKICNSSSATDDASTITDDASNTDEIEEVSLIKPYQNGVVQESSLNARQKGNCPVSDRIMVPSVSLNSLILCFQFIIPADSLETYGCWFCNTSCWHIGMPSIIRRAFFCILTLVTASLLVDNPDRYIGESLA